MTSRATARLTWRAVVLAGVGVALLVAGPLLGRREPVALGVMLLVLVAVSWILTTLQLSRGPHGSLHRVLLPAPARAGEGVQVRFQTEDPDDVPPGSVSRPGASASALSTVQDLLPPALVRRAREGRGAADATGTAGYTVQARQRGVFTVGPGTVEARDLLGLTRGRRQVVGTSRLRVLPAPITEQALESLLSSAQVGERSSDVFGVRAAPDDLLVRQHRPGDPLSRIHWGASARTQQLMVRQEESTQDSQTVLVLDCRAVSYPHGQIGVDSGDGRTWTTAPAFEHAVRHTAAVHQRLIRSGHQVHLVNQDGTPLDPDLADVALSPTTREATWAERLPADTALVVAVLGEATTRDLSHLRLQLAGSPGRRRLALLAGAAPYASELQDAGWTTVPLPGEGS